MKAQHGCVSRGAVEARRDECVCRGGVEARRDECVSRGGVEASRDECVPGGGAKAWLGKVVGLQPGPHRVVRVCCHRCSLAPLVAAACCQAG